MVLYVTAIITLVIGILAGICIGYIRAARRYITERGTQAYLAEKHLHLVRLYDIWMIGKQTGRDITEHPFFNDVNTVAIYGMSFLGVRLFHELKGNGINVAFGIDNSPKYRLPYVNIYRLSDEFPSEPDAIVITAVFSYDQILSDLRAKGMQCKIAGIDELLYGFLMHESVDEKTTHTG